MYTFALCQIQNFILNVINVGIKLCSVVTVISETTEVAVTVTPQHTYGIDLTVRINV